MQTEDLAYAEKFKDVLNWHETVLWTGRPGRKIFSRDDVLYIPLSIALASPAIACAIAALMGNPPASFLQAIVICAALGLVLYLMVGRFFYRAWLRKRIFYAVTNQRVIVLNQVAGQRANSSALEALPGVVNDIHADSGVGTLLFCKKKTCFCDHDDQWLVPRGFSREIGLCFSRIPDAARVYNLIVGLEQQAPA